jgi:hypothetical protein
MIRCKHCGYQIHSDKDLDGSIFYFDNTGGDVCGWNGGNEPHEPEDDELFTGTEIESDGT